MKYTGHFIWLQILFYLSEIITINLRTYIGYNSSIICDKIAIEHYITLTAQLLINTFCFYSLLRSGQIRYSFFSFALVLAIIGTNCYESESQYYYIVQIFVNLFGYLFIILFWENFDITGTDYTYLHTKLSILLHLIFTGSIFASQIEDLILCDPSPASILEILLEQFILGYLYGLIIKYGE
jgi:hypothetical protein